MTTPRIDYWEAAELAAAVLGIDAPETDDDEASIEDKFIEEYGIDLITFSNLAEKLLPLCAEDMSPLTNTRRKGFARDGAYIVKVSTEVE